MTVTCEHGSVCDSACENYAASASLVDLFRLTLNYKVSFAKAIIFSIVGAGLTLVLPRYITRFFNSGIFHMPSNIEIIGLIVIILTSGAFSAFQSYYLRRMGEDLVRDTRAELSKHMLNLPIGEYDHLNTGDLLSRLNDDTSKLRDMLLQGITALASGSILVIGSAIYMFILDPLLFCITTVLLLVMLFLLLISSKIVENASLSNQRDFGTLTSAVNRDLAGIRTIRAANASEKETTEIWRIIDRVRASGLKVARIQAVINPMASTGLELSAIIITGLGLWLVSEGDLSAEMLTQFIMLIFIAISPLSQIMLTSTQIGESLASLSRIMEVLAIPEERSKDDIIAASVKHPLHNLGSSATAAIEFQRVSFSYRARNRFSETGSDIHNSVLHDLSFQILRGSSVAFVGPSGAGKSTILQLIERFYEPDSGNISMLGANITSYRRETLRSHLAYVEQDSTTISGTLRDNLVLGSTTVTEEQCYRVLQSVNLGHLLTRSREGLDLRIGERGTTLSGGERQRLSIARALISSAEIVLLDEFTSDLDAQNERHIMQLLRDTAGQRTFIFVAHRLATITMVDTIHVLEHGEIVGSGTHEELISSVPLYRELAREQHLL